MICFAKFCLNVSFGGQIKIVEVVRTRIMDFSLLKRILQYPQNVIVYLLFFFVCFLFFCCFFLWKTIFLPGPGNIFSTLCWRANPQLWHRVIKPPSRPINSKAKVIDPKQYVQYKQAYLNYILKNCKKEKSINEKKAFWKTAKPMTAALFTSKQLKTLSDLINKYLKIFNWLDKK